MAYASRTGTRRNLDALRAAGWRLMVSARGVLRTEGFPYALDNGAWTARQEFEKGQRRTPDPCLKSFRRAVDALGRGADFIVVPDVVMVADRSWAMSRAWLRRLRRDRRLRGVRLLIAVQDGMQPDEISPYLSERVGVFVGGSSEWKEATASAWSTAANKRGAWCHVGRVNTARRISICADAGVDSFDGSGVSRFVKTLPPLDHARRQPSLIAAIERAA